MPRPGRIAISTIGRKLKNAFASSRCQTKKPCNGTAKATDFGPYNPIADPANDCFTWNGKWDTCQVIVEHAQLPVIPRREDDFERAFATARVITTSIPGCRSLSLTFDPRATTCCSLSGNIQTTTRSDSDNPSSTKSGAHSSTISTTRSHWSSTTKPFNGWTFNATSPTHPG